MVGPSDLPDPAFHAYRKDLADVDLAGRVVSSHYVQAEERPVIRSAAFRVAAAEDADVIADLTAGERFRLLECKFGWAWGYAGPEERVGYVKADVLGLD